MQAHDTRRLSRYELCAAVLRPVAKIPLLGLKMPCSGWPECGNRLWSTRSRVPYPLASLISVSNVPAASGESGSASGAGRRPR